MDTVLSDYAVQSFPVIFLIAAFATMFFSQKRYKHAGNAYIWAALACALILTVEHSWEKAVSSDASLVVLRTSLSFIGYVVRPASALFLIFVVETDEKRRKLLWLPEIINILIMSACFYTQSVFYFDRDGDFVRGALGYTPFVVTAFYMAIFLVTSIRFYAAGKFKGALVLTVCVLFCCIGCSLDVVYYGDNATAAIAISAIFYNLFINSHYSGLDMLTGLRNRSTFFADFSHSRGKVSAIAMLDMNGLKLINDTHGHTAGDNALMAIGNSIHACESRSITGYRLGGDEFVILFRDTAEADVIKALARVEQAVQTSGFSVSAGYALWDEQSDMQTLYSEADRNMYVKKKAYYNTIGEKHHYS